LGIVLLQALGIYYVCNQEMKSLRLVKIYLVPFNSYLFTSNFVQHNEKFIFELSFNEQISEFNTLKLWVVGSGLCFYKWKLFSLG